MFEALKDETIVHKAGGRFKLTALIQHRVRELMEGARPLIERNGRNDLEVAIQEIVEEKIELTMEEPEEDEIIADSQDDLGGLPLEDFSDPADEASEQEARPADAAH